MVGSSDLIVLGDVPPSIMPLDFRCAEAVKDDLIKEQLSDKRKQIYVNLDGH